MPIVMPKLGLTMSEGVLAEWQVAPGEEVTEGQVLFVVETDKISNEVQAPAAGRITDLLVAAGETVEVGAPVAFWTGPSHLTAAEGTAPAPTATRVRTAQAPGSNIHAADPAIRIVATPLARRLAKAHGVELRHLTGTGARGRIQARDVEAVVGARSVSAAPKPAAPGARPEAPSPPTRDRRSLIAARVARSKAEIPHFYLSAEAEFDALMVLRKQLNADPSAPRPVSVTALLAMAAARALRLHPFANAVWRDGRPTPLEECMVAIAVDTAAGVVAPVIVATGGVYGVARALDAAIDRARAGRLTAGDLAQAAIGISNVGMFGIRSLTPIIDPDATFMLGVGAAHLAFRRVQGSAPKAVDEVTLALSCDHRTIDGAPAARLLATIVEGIENPVRLLTS